MRDTVSKPRRSRIGRDIRPACVTSTGVPRAAASSRSGRDERAVGAATARRRQVAPPKRSTPRACRTRTPAATGSSSTKARKVDPSTPSRSKSAPPARAASSCGRRERLVRDRGAPARAPRPTRPAGPSRPAGLALAGAAAQHHADRDRLALVRHSPSASRRSTRSAGVLDSPSSHSAPPRPRAASSARISVDGGLDRRPVPAGAAGRP